MIPLVVFEAGSRVGINPAGGAAASIIVVVWAIVFFCSNRQTSALSRRGGGSYIPWQYEGNLGTYPGACWAGCGGDD